MSAIAGSINFEDADQAIRDCRSAVERLFPYDSAERSVAQCGPAAFGRSLYLSVSEDQFDRQPLRPTADRLFVADCRIDNRHDLADALGIERKAEGLCDAEILMHAWLRWRAGAFERVFGDFAFAAWEEGKRELTLARSPLSSKTLFYSEIGSAVSFATLPMALLRMSQVNRGLSLDEVARFIANVSTEEGNNTIFRGVRSVKPGSSLTFSNGRIAERHHWNPAVGSRAGDSVDHAAEEFRQHLLNSASFRVRRANGIVASELSSGRDSSAVTASAAEILRERGERLLVLTHAPRADYDPPYPFGRLADESEIAGGTAFLHPNIEHRVCRASGPFNFDLLQQVHAANQYPVRQLSNLGWFLQNLEVARRAGASVLLNGGAGNFTVSAGGPSVLSDLLQERGLTSWMREARHLGRQHGLMLMNSLLRGTLPKAAYSPLIRAVERRRRSPVSLPIFRPPYRSRIEELINEREEEFLGEGYGAIRKKILRGLDKGGAMTQALAGIEVRDVTVDRRLVEFCLSLGPEHLIQGFKGRPVYDRAMAGRVDPRVLRPERRGIQTADWHEVFRKEDVARCFEDAVQDEEFAELVDVQHVRALIERWPTADWHRWEVYETYRDRLLTLAATGSFIRYFRRGLR